MRLVLVWANLSAGNSREALWCVLKVCQEGVNTPFIEKTIRRSLGSGRCLQREQVNQE